MEDLPFEDKIFDVVLSRCGQMFALNPQIYIKEIIHVTKPGGCIAFSTWPSELLNGKLFKTMAKHMPANTTTSIYTSDQSEHQQQPTPMQGVNPEVIQELLLDGSSDGTTRYSL